MKSSKNFQKSKKPKPFSSEGELKAKKVDPLAKKTKYFKKEIFDEIDDAEEIDLFGYKNEDVDLDEEEIDDDED